MTVLERSELEASPLADLHAIANQVGLEGFRRMRKAELIAAIIGETGGGDADIAAGTADSAGAAESSAPADGDGDGEERDPIVPRTRRRRSSRSRRPREDGDAGEAAPSAAEDGARASGARASAPREEGEEPEPAKIAAGVVEVLGNGSAFLRVDPPEPSDEDVYISAAQVRRCELVSGDRVTGPVRMPRRSERYPSLVRIDTINGASADTVSDGGRYDELAVDWPRERLALGSQDPTLEAIEWLTPIGRGSRAVIVGAHHAGKSETLRRLLEALHGREGLELSLVLAGARPEEIAQWAEGPLAPVAALSFAASADLQDQAVERTIETAKRVAARGGNALVAIDSLDGLHPQAARKALAGARNLREGGSLTVIAVAEHPVGGETTVITLDAALTSTGRAPILDLVHSGTLRPELLVGEDGAEQITKARLTAVEAAA
jgi:transcription termination factor Rho